MCTVTWYGKGHGGSRHDMSSQSAGSLPSGQSRDQVTTTQAPSGLQTMGDGRAGGTASLLGLRWLAAGGAGAAWRPARQRSRCRRRWFNDGGGTAPPQPSLRPGLSPTHSAAPLLCRFSPHPLTPPLAPPSPPPPPTPFRAPRVLGSTQ